MGRDERVEHDGYASQDPEDVARQLEDAAALFANVLARLEPADWERVLVYNYPERTERTCDGWPSTRCTRSFTTAPTSTHSSRRRHPQRFATSE